MVFTRWLLRRTLVLPPLCAIVIVGGLIISRSLQRTELAYFLDGAIHRVEVDTRLEAPLTIAPLTDYTQLEWSPDGKQLGFIALGRASYPELHLVQADNTQSTTLTRRLSVNSFSWSPDGLSLAVLSKPTGIGELYLVDAKTGEHQRILTQVSDDVAPSWSPDGQHLVVISQRDGNSEVYAVSRDGLTVRNLSQYAGIDRYPSWSPVSNEIAYISRQESNWVLYIVNADTDEHRVLVANISFQFDFGWLPVWSSDGAYIAYSVYAFPARRVSNHEVQVVEVATGKVSILRRPSTEFLYPIWIPDDHTVFVQMFHSVTREPSGFLFDPIGNQAQPVTNFKFWYPVWKP